MIDKYVLASNDDGDLAIRTVQATESSSVTDTTSVITATDDGKLAVRVVGSGGGDQHNLGWYATSSDLQTAHPTASAGDWAIVGATDTVWIWDTDTNAWVDSDQKGQVTSVNGQTGVVVLNASDVGAVAQKSIMPTANASELGKIYQFVGTTSASYTNGYFYKCVSDGQSPATYSWEQTDVQPAGATGINWATSVDLPLNTYGGPKFTITGGLPDGVYEFYTKTKNKFYDANSPLYDTTWKISFKIATNGSVAAAGFLYPVINGQFAGVDKKLSDTSVPLYMYKKDGNWIMAFDSDAFVSNVADQTGGSLEVENCYQLSTIKNIETGNEYTATGWFGDIDSYDDTFPIYLNESTIDNMPNIPSFWSSTQFDISSVSHIYISNTWVPMGLNQSVSYTTFNIMIGLGEDMYQATLKANVGEYVLTVQKATGVFENTQLMATSDGQLWVAINAPVGSTGEMTVTISKDGSADSVYMSPNSNPPQLTALVVTTVGGTIDTSNYGAILQYTGTTTASYTNGYFYKANGTVVNVPMGGTITNVDPNGASVTIDYEELVDAAVATIGWMSRDQVITELKNYSGNINTWYVASNELYIDGVVTIDLNTYTNVATFADYGGADNVKFAIENFQDAHQEIQNGSWVRVDVQPSTKVNTTVTIAVADWNGGTTVTKTVAGITATGVVLVSPDPTDQADYTSAGILCTAQAADSLTFTCSTTPSADIDVNVVML